ncbi:MAG: glycerate kinase [Nitrospirae bacterium]|nr:glycerate kinase [Nitrospirota bacterium]
MKNRKKLISIFDAALKSVESYDSVRKSISLRNEEIIINGQVAYKINDFNKLVVVGAGKATAPMAQAVEDIFGERIDNGIIIVKYGHTRPLKKIIQIEASHPLPDASGLAGTNSIMEMLHNADAKTLVICLLSGGASSLLVSPVGDITLDDKKYVTDLLLKAGATINELNVLRKHISGVKGGRLAEMAYPASVVTLVLSDVIGDRLDVIASGPTVPDSSTFRDAMDVIGKYKLEDKVPDSVLRYIGKGLQGEIEETPMQDGVLFGNVRNVIVGSIKQALAAAAEKAESLGHKAEIIATDIQGDVSQVAGYLAEKAIEAKKPLKNGSEPVCLLSGGETTVAVKGKGLGGRNQELALAFAMAIEGEKGITMLSAGTDGTDGPTDAAGAIVDGETFSLACKYGIDPITYLGNNDSYNFFKNLDSLTGMHHHMITGPTWTNVMDMQIMLAEAGD